METTPRTLAEFIQTCGRTQATIAAELGISEGHLSRLVGGTRQPSLPLALRIASLTGVPVESLLMQGLPVEGADDMEPEAKPQSAA